MISKTNTKELTELVVLAPQCPQCNMPMVEDTIMEEGHRYKIMVCTCCDLSTTAQTCVKVFKEAPNNNLAVVFFVANNHTAARLFCNFNQEIAGILIAARERVNSGRGF